MKKKAKKIREQLNSLKPFIGYVPLKIERLWQNKFGDVLRKEYKRDVSYERINIGSIVADIVTTDTAKSGVVILYIHGGGFAVGDIEYARGFATTLAGALNYKTMCIEYRLAPEYKFPCALDDVYESYKYLLETGYKPKDIILCGESAGGGLCYGLCQRLIDENCDLPAGVITISPWVDLTLSGESYDKNKDADPSMTKEKLEKYAKMYTDSVDNPYASPVFSKFNNSMKNLVFVSENEILLSDSVSMHEKLLNVGSESTIVITPNMWHAYVLYDTSESDQDLEIMRRFIREVTGGR